LPEILGGKLYMYLWQKILIAVVIIGGILATIVLSIFVFLLGAQLVENEMLIEALERDLNVALQIPHEQVATAFRVIEPTRQGSTFNPMNVERVPIPQSLHNDSFVSDPALLTNAIWRIGLNAGGIITYDMLSFETIFPTDRFHLIEVGTFSPRLMPGDFVDIRMTTPDAMSFVVFPKMRILNVFPSGLEVVMSETEYMILQGLLIDMALNPGSVLRAYAYIDSALQPALYGTYIPPQEIISFMNLNMNMIFPYAESLDINSMRRIIESSQPEHRLTILNPMTEEQRIRQRRNSIVGSLERQSSNLSIARNAWVSQIREYYSERGETWAGEVILETDTPTTVGMIVNPDGTFTNPETGQTFFADGTPQIGIGDMVNIPQNQQQDADLQNFFGGGGNQ